MTDDPELLRRYAEEDSEPAFAEFVQRHVDLVYSAAVRRLNGDTHRAADVTQQVFVAAARHARSLAARPVITGWLYTATRNAAVDAIRREQRRVAAEAAMRLMNEANEPAARAEDWQRLRPQLDAAMDELTEREREALLLRFFENRSYPEIGARCAIAADAARMRVDRALEKLHAVLGRRGVASTGAALAVLLAEQSVSAAPAGLAALATGAALAPGAAATTAGVIGFMSSTKVAIGVGGALLALALGTASYQVKTEHAAQTAAAAALAGKESAAAALRALDHDAALARQQTAAARSAAPAAAARPANDTRAAAETGAAKGLAKGKAPVARGRAARPGGPVTAADSGASDPAANTARLLASNPQIQDLFQQVQKAQADAMWGPLLAQLKLSSDQAVQFEQLMSNGMQMNLMLPGGPYQFGAPLDPTAAQDRMAQLSALLGDDGMQQFRDYTQTLGGRTVANQVAGTAAAVAAPLTPAQMASLASLFTGFRPTQAASFDWDSAATSAATFLSPQQIDALKAVGNQVQVNSQILPPSPGRGDQGSHPKSS